MDLADIIRKAIAASGKTQYALSKETGVPQSRISAFINGGGLRLEHAGSLMDAVGVKVLTPRKRKR